MKNGRKTVKIHYKGKVKKVSQYCKNTSCLKSILTATLKFGYLYAPDITREFVP